VLSCRGEFLRSRFRWLRVSVTSGYCQPIFGKKHWGAMTIAVRWAIESDVGHRARKNLEIFFGARNASTDGFAARLCCLDDPLFPCRRPWRMPANSLDPLKREGRGRNASIAARFPGDQGSGGNWSCPGVRLPSCSPGP
jgi:hypothetical protein